MIKWLLCFRFNLCWALVPVTFGCVWPNLFVFAYKCMKILCFWKHIERHLHSASVLSYENNLEKIADAMSQCFQGYVQFYWEHERYWNVRRAPTFPRASTEALSCGWTFTVNFAIFFRFWDRLVLVVNFDQLQWSFAHLSLPLVETSSVQVRLL